MFIEQLVAYAAQVEDECPSRNVAVARSGKFPSPPHPSLPPFCPWLWHVARPPENLVAQVQATATKRESWALFDPGPTNPPHLIVMLLHSHGNGSDFTISKTIITLFHEQLNFKTFRSSARPL